MKSAYLREQLLGETFQKVYHIFCRIICLATFLVQFAILDVYLVLYKDLVWTLWIIADLSVLVVFLAATILSYRHLSPRSNISRSRMGELPISYITWLFYSIILSAKFCIIFALPHNDGSENESNLQSVARSLKESNFFGPNMLQTSLSLTSIVLYMFVLTNHDSKSESDQSSFIQAIIGTSYVDILDTVSFTGVLLKDPTMLLRYHLDKISMLIITFNFILPTEALFILSRSCYGKFPLRRRNRLLYKVILFIVVNVPMFLVRMVIWHMHDQNVSVFLVKNVLAMGLAVKDIHDFLVEVTKVIVTDGTDGAPADKEENEENKNLNVIELGEVKTKHEERVAKEVES